jgi:hypothetical protein
MRCRNQIDEGGAAVSKQSLEERVASLEREVAALKANALNGQRRKDWRRTIGIFTDNPGMQRVFEEAMKLREADRARARRPRKRRQAKA